MGAIDLMPIMYVRARADRELSARGAIKSFIAMYKSVVSEKRAMTSQ